MASLICRFSAQRFLARLGLGRFFLVVGAALAVPVPDLGDRDRMDGVAVAAVAAPDSR